MGPHTGGNHRHGSHNTIRVRTMVNAKVVLTDINDCGQSSLLCKQLCPEARVSLKKLRRKADDV